jgi:hypothetical protein
MKQQDPQRSAVPEPRQVIALLTALAMLAAGGCRPKPKYPTATVSGRVTIDGAPVPKGSINFAPVSGTTGAVVGADIKAGVYRCDLVPLGKLNVTFIAHAAEPTKMIEKATGMTREVPLDILPPAYANGLAVEITGNRKDMDFDLKSKGP